MDGGMGLHSYIARVDLERKHVIRELNRAKIQVPQISILHIVDPAEHFSVSGTDWKGTGGRRHSDWASRFWAVSLLDCTVFDRFWPGFAAARLRLGLLNLLEKKNSVGLTLVVSDFHINLIQEGPCQVYLHSQLRRSRSGF
ncbi:hypothetical protein MTR67_045545 [Solanum verrucosum]|uniref:Uncharacterized protein n=1 Tax=Solanum verrucosum TaxID=315347 RepID=A0AAF0ZWR2_SOLVR|nr:hypothetical protein MTR67_045545 [Solanum verrucosum]